MFVPERDQEIFVCVLNFIYDNSNLFISVSGPLMSPIYIRVCGWELSLENAAVKAHAKAMLQGQVDKIAASPYSPDYGEQRLDKLLAR